MPPKRVKSGTVSAAGATAVGNKGWETGLTNAPFEEETWKASISLVVGERLEDEELTGALLLAVQQPLRRLFSVVTWDTTLEKINELGNPKIKKTKDVPMFYEVMEAAKVLLDAGEELPCDLLGKLLKFQLLGVKANDQQKRATEMRAAEEKGKGKAGNASPTKDKGGAKPAAKGDKGKKGAEPSAPTKDTKLKKRGEEDETNKYIDDEPDDGPQHYILVVGFQQAQLVSVLDSLGVHVSNVIKLTSQRPDRPEGSLEGSDDTPLDVDAETNIRRRQQEQFWGQLEGVLNSGSAFSKLFDVARLSHTAKEILPPQDKDSPEAMLGFGTRLFEDVACLIYDCLDWRRQHQHYLNNMRLVQVPSVPRAVARTTQDSPAETVQTTTPQTPGSKKRQAQEETTPADPEPAALSTDVDMRYYNDLLDQIPPEASSVPLILHCMLEQVVATEQDIPPLSTADSEKGVYSLEKSLADYMLSAVMSLPRSDQEKKTLRETFGAVENTQQKTEHQRPLLINCHDERALRLHHLPVHNSVDAVKTETEMMRNTPVWNLLRSVRPLSGNRTRLARIQELTHYCTDESLSWPEVERVVRQFVFESMPLTQLEEGGLLTSAGSPQPTCLPWDDPVCFAKNYLRHINKTQGKAFHLQDESEESLSDVVDVTEMQRSRMRSLSDWHYTEHHNANVFPQILHSASQSYRCMDTFCGSLDNTLFIVCHNPMSPQRQCKELWDMALHTNVGFRKYLEHVANSISDWTEEEEVKWLALQAKREAEKLRGPTPPDSSEKGRTESAKGTKKGTVSTKHTATSPAKSPVPEEGPPDQYIREDSLKAWKMEQDRQKEEEQVKKAKKDKGGKGAERADSSKENKKTAPSTTKKSREDVTPDLAVGTPGEQRAKLQSPTDVFTGFTGYSMEGQLIQVSGQVHSLYPSDGGHIQVETIHFVQGSTLIKVCVMKDKHHLYSHITQPNRHQEESPKDAVPMETQSPTNKSVWLGSFSAVLDSGIHLSYSHYDPTGEQGEMEAGQDSDLDMPTDSSLSPVPSTLLSSSLSREKLNSSHSAKGVQPSKETNKSSTHREEEEQTRECVGQAALSGSAPFQRLNLSTPSGLLLQFLREDTEGSTPEGQCVLVRQTFPLHCSDSREPHLTDPSLHSELSRVITGQGTVVKYMRDGSTQVLFADGSVSSSTDSGPIVSSPPEPPAKEEEVVKETPIPERKDSKDKKGKLGSKQSLGADQSQSDPEPREEQRSSDNTQGRQGVCWVTTSPSGHRVATMGDQTTDPGPVLAFRATDPVSQTVVITREDKVMSVLDRDGTVIVDHADGTRITTLYQEREALSGWCQEHISTGERSSSGCHKEKVVMVERLGFATVTMFGEGRSCNVFFGDGSVVTATCDGAYQVYPSSVGLLFINQDGSCVYTSDPEHSPTLSLASWSPREQPGSYRMNHTSTSDTLCEVTDHHGNLFQVMKDGQASVEISSPLDSRVEEEEEEEGGLPEERELAKHSIGRKVHIPRLFMAHEDGSGTELLHSQTVEERLYEDYSDPAVALLKEPLPDLQGVLGIAVLRPSRQDVWSRWVMQKQNKDIIPTNLKSRRWDNFPSVERKTPGPLFGTTLGRGLTLREKPVSEACRPVLSCPDTLEVRQLLQYQPVSRQLRRTLETRLKEYMEQVIQRENLTEKMQLNDPRTEEEKIHAADLLKLVLSLPESEHPTIENRICPVDAATLYIQAVKTPALQTEASLSEKHTDSFSEEAKDIMWKSRIEQHRQELDQEKIYREALRNRIIPPYFHSEKGAGFEYSEVPDMRSLSQDLPPFPNTPNSQNYLRDAPRETAQRPLNPTPSHAAGSDALPRRPTNPTPQTAGDSSHGASTVKQQHGGGIGPGSTQVDVAGNPRRHRVKLPASILSSKPFSVPNQQFLCVEEPVRRKVKTVSVTGGQQLAPRGFELLPAEVQFGTLKEGCSYSVPVLMKNVGFHTCRFSVKQPSPGTGIRVIYTPGPVAAGMKTELQVELNAMTIGLEESAEGEVYISHHIHIKTETEIFYLPVLATILPERLYDTRTKDHTNGLQTGVSKVRLISSTPSVRRGVVLPRRPLLSSTGEIESDGLRRLI